MDRLGFEFKVLGDEVKQNDVGQDIGIVEGLASTFGNVDRVNDIMMPGAFRGAKPGIPMLWQHDQKKPIGRVVSLEETSRGLEFKAELILAVPEAKSAWELARGGVITSTSIGYRVKKGGSDFVKMKDPETKRERRVRRLKSVDLAEISMVTTPANAMAAISSVKGIYDDLLDVADFEAWLREAGGLSRAEAKCIIAKGYKHLLSEKRAENDQESDEEIVEEWSDDDDADQREAVEGVKEAEEEFVEIEVIDDDAVDLAEARKAADLAAKKMFDQANLHLSQLLEEMNDD